MASQTQLASVAERVSTLARTAEVIVGGDGASPLGAGTQHGALFAPTLLVEADPHGSAAVDEVEAFGPVCALMPYGEFDEATSCSAGQGSLIGTLVTSDPTTAALALPELAAHDRRLLVLDAESAAESTGHGTPLAPLKHDGPGRGGGEELGGLRAVHHHLQRAAVQGSPAALDAITGNRPAT